MKTTKKNPVVAALLSAVSEHHKAQPHKPKDTPPLSNKRKLLALASHRNGISGVPFTVAVMKKGKTRMLVIRFDDDKGCFTAALDLDLAAAGEIRFGVNSFRGDHYADDMKQLSDHLNQ